MDPTCTDMWKLLRGLFCIKAADVMVYTCYTHARCNVQACDGMCSVRITREPLCCIIQVRALKRVSARALREAIQPSASRMIYVNLDWDEYEIVPPGSFQAHEFSPCTDAHFGEAMGCEFSELAVRPRSAEQLMAILAPWRASPAPPNHHLLDVRKRCAKMPRFYAGRVTMAICL